MGNHGISVQSWMSETDVDNSLLANLCIYMNLIDSARNELLGYPQVVIILLKLIFVLTDSLSTPKGCK